MLQTYHAKTSAALRLMAVLLLASLLLFLLFFFFPSDATNQIIFFTEAELTGAGTIDDDTAGPELIFPAGKDDEVKQEDVRVIGLADGNLLVGWDIDIGFGDLNARIFDANGTALTGDINVYDSGGNSNDVAFTPTKDGGFYALWFNGTDIRARKFNSSGVALGASTVIVTSTVDIREPEMVELINGNFMLTYHAALNGIEVMARLYDTALAPLTAPIVVNDLTQTAYIRPDVAPLPDGGSAVSWPGKAADDSHAIFLQRFNFNGAKLGQNIQVNQAAANSQRSAQIAPLSNGNVVIVYESVTVDNTPLSIGGRIFDADGNAVTAEFAVNQTYRDSYQILPDAVGLKDGSFVVVWESLGSEEGPNGGTGTILAVQLAADGTPLSDEFIVNQSIAGKQHYPFVSAIEGKLPVVVWEGVELNDPDGDDLRSTDGFMRYLFLDSVTTAQFQVGDPTGLTNTLISLVGSNAVIGITIQVVTNYEIGVDSLSISPTQNLTANFDPNTGLLALSGSSQLDTYAAALQTLRFQSGTTAGGTEKVLRWTLQGEDGPLDTLDSTIEIVPADTPTPSATPTETTTPSPSPTMAITPTLTATPTVTGTPVITLTPTPTSTFMLTATPTATATPMITGTPTISGTPMLTMTPTATLSATATPMITGTLSATPSMTGTQTVTPTATVTVSITVTPIAMTPTITGTLTVEPTPTLTPGGLGTPTVADRFLFIPWVAHKE